MKKSTTNYIDVLKINRPDVFKRGSKTHQLIKRLADPLKISQKK